MSFPARLGIHELISKWIPDNNIRERQKENKGINIKNLLYIISVIIVALVAAIFFADSFSSSSSEEKVKNINKKIERIISLSPSTTETLFALGLGNKVVGRTRFCNYPPEAKRITEVGGYIDPNYEAMIALKPDLVILLPEQEKVKKYLNELKINHFTVDNKTVSDIKNTIKTIGDTCSAQLSSIKLLNNINTIIEKIKIKTKELKKPKVIISIGRTPGTNGVKDVYIAGRNTSYDELINIAGGRNAFEDSNILYPMLSAEGLIHLNPDIIFDFIPNFDKNNLTRELVLKDWQSIKSVNAVKNNRVNILTADYISIPGPRFILLLKDLAKAIHPEIDWDELDIKQVDN
ncbi:MAG: helical backbone metal receptor [Melioribacteraceae bacterium]